MVVICSVRARRLGPGEMSAKCPSLGTGYSGKEPGVAAHAEVPTQRCRDSMVSEASWCASPANSVTDRAPENKVGKWPNKVSEFNLWPLHCSCMHTHACKTHTLSHSLIYLQRIPTTHGGFSVDSCMQDANWLQVQLDPGAHATLFSVLSTRSV